MSSDDPGELFAADGDIEINADRPAITLIVADTGDLTIQVGSTTISMKPIWPCGGSISNAAVLLLYWFSSCDLWFHSLVLMSHFDIGVDDIMVEFRRREGISGIDEKKNRGAA